MAGTYFAPGQWNFICDLCGRKGKSGIAVKTWKGTYVCRSHREARNPQDFLRSVSYETAIPWSRPGVSAASTPPLPATVCTYNGSSDIVDYAVADCAVVDFLSPLFDPAVLPPLRTPLLVYVPSAISAPGLLWAGDSATISSDLTVSGTLGIY